jgi:CheY-like chemotaxis protein/HPt (histidine-containing phosphotransfer) domain-containing protein/two-component sensor histidine kinase
MSHEIRTPMNAVTGMLYLLRQTELTGRQKNYLDKAHTASSMLLRLINDILDFSKIEAGKLELESVPFRLAGVLRDLRTVATATIGQQPIELHVNSAPEVPDLLVGDPLRLGQILLNLASNAVKFTEDGSIDVEVSRVSATDGEVLLRFSVTDTGIGMTPEQQGVLFTAFSQADNSTTRKYGGTGLGLAISKHLVELMRGSISVTSRPGAGSTFSFTIPMQTQSAEQAAAARKRCQSQALLAPIDSEFAGVRVLLVEDNPINLELASELLERRGIQVDLAQDGREALTHLATSGIEYDAILMDVHMPVMGGLETTRALRMNPEFAALPVIAMTACAMAGERELCIEAGMNDQVDKPIDVAELFATLKRWVRRPGQNPAEAAADPSAADARAAGFSRPLPGIDLDRALRTVESGPLLKKLLITFGVENAGIAEELLRTLSQGDRLGARRMVHTVKGVAGNLGATGLFEASIALEQALQSENDLEALRPFLDQFQEKLAEVLASVSALEREELARSEAASPAGAEAEQKRLAPLARRLGKLLESQNLNALGVWEEMKPLLSEEAAQRLDEKLAGLDFEDASRLLGVIMQDLEIAS